MKEDERGYVVVEAAYVFPIMFFVIIFLFYMGNAYYIRSQITNCTAQAAIIGAERCADPLAKKMSEGAVEMNTDPEVYRYIFTGYMDGIATNVAEELNETISASGSFFVGMEASAVLCECKYKGSLVEPSFVAEATYKINFPIKFIFSDETISLDMEAKAEAPIVDMRDFIGTVDMIEDYYQRSNLKDKIDGIKDKISGLLKK